MNASLTKRARRKVRNTPRQPRWRYVITPSLALLLVAPAGCGKTEALAISGRSSSSRPRASSDRAKSLSLLSPTGRRTICAIVSATICLPTQRHHVTVANFHGLASDHSSTTARSDGIDPHIGDADTDW